MERAEKREFVTSLNEVFKTSGSIVVAHYAGLSVAQMNDLRTKMREAGGTVKVAKNRLAKIALKGTDAEGISGLFQGQTMIAYSDDPIVAPKVAVDFAKTNDNLVVLGGSMGTTELDEDGVKGTCLAAVDRRAAGEDCRHDFDAGNAHRPGRQRTGGSARSCRWCLCQ